MLNKLFNQIGCKDVWNWCFVETDSIQHRRDDWDDFNSSYTS